MGRRRSSRRRKGWRFRLVALAAMGLVGYLASGRAGQFGLPGFGPTTPRVPSADAGTSASVSQDSSQSQRVLVERVVDGDTLVISGGDRVRLIGVDTPETHHPTKPAQPYGQEAYEFTRRMVEGKWVELRYDPGETKDRYGRTLAYVYIDGRFLNETLIQQGLARAMTNYPFSSSMKSRFRAAEVQAKSARRGVWSLPQSPFDVTSQPSGKKAG